MAPRRGELPLLLNTPSKKANPTRGANAQSLLSKFLQGKPVRISVSTLPEWSKTPREYYEQLDQFYKEWFSSVITIIEKSGRQNEFADLLPLFKRIKTQFVKEGEPADVIVKILPEIIIQLQCGASACYIVKPYDPDYVPQMLLSQENSKESRRVQERTFKKQALHEIGHSLGLNDQYAQARNKNPSRYASAYIYDGIMNKSSRISCDEADGLINLSDILRGTARGGNKGWKSLCPFSKDYYIRGRSALRGPYWISSPYPGVFVLETYQAGKVISSQTYALADQPAFVPLDPHMREKVLKRDLFDRPVVSQGANGEKIYYTYFFEGYFRLAVKNGQALWAEKDVSFRDGSTPILETAFFFKRKGTPTAIQLEKMGKKYFLWYKEAPQFGKEIQSRLIVLNADGKAIGYSLDDKSRALASLQANLLHPNKAPRSPQQKMQRQLMEFFQQAQFQEQLLQWARQKIK